MGRRLILDTAVLIEVERGRRRLVELIAPDDDVAVAAVTVAELWHGVERAADPATRVKRAEFVKAAVDKLLVEDYTTGTSLEHGRLLAHAAKVGKPRGAHDLIIAATAANTGRVVVTGDRAAHFSELPGVGLLLL